MSYYEILELDESALITDIKKAYKKLAIKNHPDKGGDPEKFNKICEAYQILSNPEKKGEYDNFGRFTNDFNNLVINSNDLFEQFFGIGNKANSFRTNNIDSIFKNLVEINEKTKNNSMFTSNN